MNRDLLRFTLIHFYLKILEIVFKYHRFDALQNTIFACSLQSTIDFD